MAGARVTVTLPEELVRDMDRQAADRAAFITEAVRHELGRSRREGLRRSLYAPHPESAEHESLGIAEWPAGPPREDAGDLGDLSRRGLEEDAERFHSCPPPALFLKRARRIGVFSAAFGAAGDEDAAAQA